MDVELTAEAKDKKLNRLVAITVVVLSVFTGLCNIKDGNIVQAMQQAKADAVDRWAEYQATKTKLHISQAARDEIQLLGTVGSPTAHMLASNHLSELDQSLAHYNQSAPALSQRAQALEAKYDALNVHDDQFDASEALISTAISMAAVAALAESFGLLAAAWAFGAFGIFMGICGFAGWGFHPDILSNFLG